MARISVSPQQFADYMLTPSMTAPNVDGDVLDPGAVYLVVLTTTNPVTVTVQTPVVVSGFDVEELQVVVPVGTVPTLIGPLPARLYARKDSEVTDPNKVYVDYSIQAGVTRALVAV